MDVVVVITALLAPLAGPIGCAIFMEEQAGKDLAQRAGEAG